MLLLGSNTTVWQSVFVLFALKDVRKKQASKQCAELQNTDTKLCTLHRKLLMQHSATEAVT